jgi:WD40 repeat protein
MKTISAIKAAIRRPRTRMLLERAIGLLMLAALAYWAWAEFVTFVTIVYLVAIGIIEDWRALLEDAVIGVFGAVALVAWWTLLLPGKRRSSQSIPSFGQLVFGLAVLLKTVAGWPVRIATMNPSMEDGKTRWYVRSIIVLLTAAASMIACAAASWLVRSALAALMPLLGIMSCRLATAVPSVGPETRLERAVAASALGLLSLFVLFAAWQYERIDSEQRTAEALKAAIVAGGIGGGGWNDLQEVLQLSIFAQETSASRLSAETLRRAIDALPVRTASVNSRQPDAEITQIALSPTGALIAAATREDVRIWAKATGDEIGRFACEYFRAFAFSPNDSVVAAACGSQTLVVWDIGARGALFQAPVSNPSRLQISPDSRYIATIDDRNCVELFSIPNHSTLGRRCAESATIDVMFERAGSHVAIARKGDPVSLEFLDLASSPPTASTDAPPAWNPANEAFVHLTGPNEATAFSWRSGQAIKKIDHTNLFRAHVSAAGDRLITVGRAARPSPSRDRLEFKVWTLPDGAPYDSLQVDDDSVDTMIVDQDAQVVAWRNSENGAYYWKVGDKPPHFAIPTNTPIALDAAHHGLMVSSGYSALLWSFDSGSKMALLGPDEKVIDVQFASASRTAVLYADHVLVLDSANGSHVAVIAKADVEEVVVAPSGDHAIVRSKDGELTLWSLSAGTAALVGLPLPRNPWRANVAFAPDSTMLVVDTGTGELQLFNLANIAAAPVRIPFGSAYDTQIAFTSDGRYLAANGAEAIIIVDVAERKQILTIPVPQWQGHGYARAAFQPESHRLVVAYTQYPRSTQEAMAGLGDAIMGVSRGRLAIWDVDRKRETMRKSTDHVQDPDLLVISQDGALAALANSLNAPIEIWDLERGALLARIEERDLETLAFSDDDKYLFTASRNGVSRTWATDTGVELDRLPVTNLKAARLVGHYAMTAAGSGEVLRWLIDPRALLAAGCARLDPGVGRRFAKFDLVDQICATNGPATTHRDGG